MYDDDDGINRILHYSLQRVRTSRRLVYRLLGWIGLKLSIHIEALLSRSSVPPTDLAAKWNVAVVGVFETPFFF
jgi:hypothetical protein